MIYLLSSEYELYTLDPSTPDALVAAASSLIDAHCRRPTLALQQYTERLRIAEGRNSVRLTYLPLATVAPAPSPIVSAQARYAMPRRGEAAMTLVANPALAQLAFDVAQAFALPGAWTTLAVSSIDFRAETGELTFPFSVLGLAYNEVEITYNAGLAAIPDAVKFACAQIVHNAQATPALNLRAATIDRMHMDYFSDSLLDSTVRSLLAPYVAQKIG